jgi:hypothetical protein
MAEKETKKAVEPLSPQLKAVVAIIKESEHDGFFGTGFSIQEAAQKAEFRGLKGEEMWTQEMLQKVTSQYQQQIDSHPTEPEKIDEALHLLSAKISVNIDRIRRCYYGIPEPVSVAPEPVDLFPEEEKNDNEQ